MDRGRLPVSWFGLIFRGHVRSVVTIFQRKWPATISQETAVIPTAHRSVTTHLRTACLAIEAVGLACQDFTSRPAGGERLLFQAGHFYLRRVAGLRLRFGRGNRMAQAMVRLRLQ